MPVRRVDRPRAWISFLAAATLAVTACGGDPVATTDSSPPTVPDTRSEASSTTSQPGPDEGGFGVAAAAGEFAALPGTVMVGTAELDEIGCWYLANNGESVLLVAPVGTELGADGETLVLPDGTSIENGTVVDAKGGLVTLEALPGGPDGRWTEYVSFCAPRNRSVAVAESLAPAFDPDDADPVSLARSLEASTFETDFGCGYGFATGDVDGRWALRIDVMIPEPPPAGSVTLPDDRFRVTVRSGAHLFANHCDDVAEWFEPSPIAVVDWPVVAGTFDYPDATGGPCTGGERVTVVLSGAVVETSDGPVALDPIEITNDAFGCFAG